MALPVGLALVTWSIVAEEVKFTLPPESNRFKPGPGSEIAAAQCVICHSADYVSTQPPMPRAFWKAGVQKMQKVYGAPIPDEQVDRLVDYLTRNYGDEKPRGVAPPATEAPAK
jgi:mono/diheme cytochrome c family protein